ncbi:MAG: MBL fold metallo-hydrolase, partial [Nitrospinae bacterium]|nr:MBL fold metallo-hydrolase [Nitrospinota bacterium]
TLFLSSMGRPDLGGRAAEWVGDLWNTIRGLGRFGDDLLILPAHSSGKGELDDRWQVKGTLGALRKKNHLLTISDRAAFEREILAHLPPEPASYQKMRQANLGLETPDEAGADLLELGRNRCAVERAK